MSLTAPVHPEPKQLFRWSNDFAWSYGGNVADSIAERVKKAGGKVEGATCAYRCRGSTTTTSICTFIEPPGRGLGGMRDHIFFGNKCGVNRRHARRRHERRQWHDARARRKRRLDGQDAERGLQVVVNNYAKREAIDVGFVIEVECGGKLSHFSYNKAVRDKQDIHVVTLHMSGGVLERFETGDPTITTSNISQTRWGISTEQYVQGRRCHALPQLLGRQCRGQ